MDNIKELYVMYTLNTKYTKCNKYNKYNRYLFIKCDMAIGMLAVHLAMEHSHERPS